jgi:hypothetical protein
MKGLREKGIKKGGKERRNELKKRRRGQRS